MSETLFSPARPVNAISPPQRSRMWRLGRALRRWPSLAAGMALLGTLVLAALVAPLLSPYDPIKIMVSAPLQPPSAAHPLGTDRLGRDQLSRILHGGRVSLGVGIIAVGLSIMLGVPLGLVSGYWGGRVGSVINAYTEVLLAFPGFLLALVIVFALGPNLTNVMIAVAISSSPSYIRLVRGQVLQLRVQPYIEAARAVGCRSARIVLLHILPNLLSPIIVLATLGLGGAILSAAGLSFLGAGAQPPTPEWGAMLNEGRSVIRSAWWLTAFPGLAIMLAVLALNLAGDGLRDALDPRLR